MVTLDGDRLAITNQALRDLSGCNGLLVRDWLVFVFYSSPFPIPHSPLPIPHSPFPLIPRGGPEFPNHLLPIAS
ncbi:synovial apoptosis inhibitor 1, synoviolin [Tolypothrix sp. PCC 7601]|nr:synovial apoptosis inhibitor 1, synoviolin [Tolypothrix sp. PCC 7601]